MLVNIQLDGKEIAFIFGVTCAASATATGLILKKISKPKNAETYAPATSK